MEGLFSKDWYAELMLNALGSVRTRAALTEPAQLRLNQVTKADKLDELRSFIDEEVATGDSITKQEADDIRKLLGLT